MYYRNNENILPEQLVLRWNMFVFLENIFLARVNEKSKRLLHKKKSDWFKIQ
jgi:hypothetical protein